MESPQILLCVSAVQITATAQNACTVLVVRLVDGICSVFDELLPSTYVDDVLSSGYQ